MQISLTKYCKTKFSSVWKDYTQLPHRIYSWNKGWFETKIDQCNIHINKIKRKKTHYHPNFCICQNSTSFYNKNSQHTSNRRKLPQRKKSHIWKTHGEHHNQWWKTENFSSQIKNKARVCAFITSIQHNTKLIHSN